MIDDYENSHHSDGTVKTARTTDLMTVFVHIYLAVLVFLMAPGSAGGTFLYKSYIVRHDQGWDILCDPYIVQKDDWVIKIFLRRGQIAEQDFPEFLKIFERLNPHIRNIDKIRPGQHIVIPLKKLSEDALPGQSSGIVTIPFVTISKLPDIIKINSAAYKVRRGDYVSRIVSRTYGKYGTRLYNEGIQLFKLINPGMVDFDLIYPGQILNIPDPSLLNKPWYASLFDSSGNIKKNIDISGLTSPEDRTDERPLETQPDKQQEPEIKSPFFKAASVLNATLLAKGTYYFPRKGKNDFTLDLDRYPVMELKNGRRILFSETNDFSSSDSAVMQSYWKGLKIVPLSLQSTFEQILDSIFQADENYELKNQLRIEDQGVIINIKANWIIKSALSEQNSAQHTCIFLIGNKDQTIPNSINRYLSDHHVVIKEILSSGIPLKKENQSILNELLVNKNKVIHYQGDLKTFVNDLSNALGYQYSENISISFPYAGIQIDAFSNLISTPKGEQLLVDYGDLYGDAISAIKKTGLNIIQLTPKADWETAVKKIINALQISYIDHPNFMVAARPEDFNIGINIPGFDIETAKGDNILIAPLLPHPELTRFINETGKIVVGITVMNESKPVEGALKQ